MAQGPAHATPAQLQVNPAPPAPPAPAPVVTWRQNRRRKWIVEDNAVLANHNTQLNELFNNITLDPSWGRQTANALDYFRFCFAKYIMPLQGLPADPVEKCLDLLRKRSATELSDAPGFSAYCIAAATFNTSAAITKYTDVCTGCSPKGRVNARYMCSRLKRIPGATDEDAPRYEIHPANLALL